MHFLFVLLCVICLKELFPIFKCGNHNCTCRCNFKYSRYNSSEQPSNTMIVVYSFHSILYTCCPLSSFSIWEILQLHMWTSEVVRKNIKCKKVPTYQYIFPFHPILFADVFLQHRMVKLWMPLSISSNWLFR